MAELVANAEMLIREPVAEVFDAFVNPSVTSRFWFSEGSGRLQPGKRITWTWKWYDFSVDADVKAVEPKKSIVVDKAFQGSVEEAAQMAVDATEGFSFVLAGAKAWLEHGIQLNLVPDRFPDGLPPS